MSDRITAMRVFQRVARRGSLTRAARDLGLSQPSASRIMAELEHELGATLLVRTTRAMRLTERGADYLARIEPILQALEEADHAVRATGELRGTMRIGMSSSVGVREIIPRLPAFLARHPELRVDVAVSDALHDLIADGLDVALRAAPLSDSTAIARKLAETERVVAAAPSYLIRAGTPATPRDLAAHAMILGPAATNALRFRRGNRTASIQPSGRLAVATNEAATAAAVAGLGITVTSVWGCRAELERGELVRVLSDWTLPPVALHAVFPRGRGALPAVRALIEYLVGQLPTECPPGATLDR
ncbi:MAG TPA: LysR family transcriptional regulator [Kofleriaceae bacterium]|nr:LysR family transcriptional regulator [Kofleriaceae bacterium]